MNIAFFGRVRISTTAPPRLAHPEQLRANFQQLWEHRFDELDDLLKSSQIVASGPATAVV